MLRALRRPLTAQGAAARRWFARESKKPFEAPPDPPASKVDMIRWPIVAVTFGGVAYIVFLPENDHGLFSTDAGPPAPTSG